MVRALPDTWKPPGLPWLDYRLAVPRGSLSSRLTALQPKRWRPSRAGSTGERSERILDGAPERRLAGLCHDSVFKTDLHRKPSENFALVQTLTTALVLIDRDRHRRSARGDHCDSAKATF